jgi:hypothetical protein
MAASMEMPTSAPQSSGTSEGREFITVRYPSQKFQPTPFCSLEVGGVSYTTYIAPGETREEAWKRAWDFLTQQVRDSFKGLVDEYEIRHKEVKRRFGG